MSDFDRDLAGLSEEEGSEDAYYAQLPSGTGAGKKKPATAGASADDEEDEEDNEPSVEELIHQQESGQTEEKHEKKKKVVNPDDEDAPIDELALIEEAAQGIEAERDELFSEEEEEN